MFYIKRCVSTLTETLTGEKAKQIYDRCQASINSDGCITIRNYDNYTNNKNEDEMIVLSKSETDAVFKLFSTIGQKVNSYNLPF